MHQSVGERIETLVYFHHGSLKPLRFRWQNRTYPVNQITSTYTVKSGGFSQHVFSVQSQGNLYELLYNPADQTWTLNQIYLDG